MSATPRAGVLLLLLAACGGGDRAARTDTTGMSSAPPPAAQPPAAPDSAATSSARDTIMRPSSAAVAAGPARARRAQATQDTGKQDTTKKAAAKPAPAPAAAGPGSPQLVALGDSIFHGQVAGGTCTACHGQDAKGTGIAPDLTDGTWINGDGSYDFIVHTVTTGVPHPKEHPAPMPPKGGATLNDDQVKAVAAYVYSLSHKS